MDMTVRDLIRQLVEFNPDAKIDVDLGNGKPTSFSLAWGALDGEGMNKVKTSSVSIYVEDADNEPNCDQSTDVVQRTWLFCGGYGKKYFEIEISAEDRETAIAYFETDYPELKWVMTKEL